MKGIVTDIQHCSVHDGKGIRTTIFLKGCNMKCKWCHNPETIHTMPEILTDESKCIGCKMCDSGCFSGAKILCGKEMSVQEILDDISLDIPYYGEHGGVTVSGGEPILQYEFLKELILAFKEKKINVAIETNLSLKTQNVIDICAMCDFIMCDLKIFDRNLHKQYTSIVNDNILHNLKEISKLGKPIIVRTPIISDINDTETEISAITHFLSQLENIEYYELLTYHPLGLSKNKSANFTSEQFKKASKATMEQLASIGIMNGLSIRIDNIAFKNDGGTTNDLRTTS